MNDCIQLSIPLEQIIEELEHFKVNAKEELNNWVYRKHSEESPYYQNIISHYESKVQMINVLLEHYRS